VFVAGATGVVGRRLCMLLRSARHDVVGTTRSAARAAGLTLLGVDPVEVDVFDGEALRSAVARAMPDVVIHQLTDLPRQCDPETMAAARDSNARLRIEGTRNLVAAAQAAGVSRLIAQSVAFAYAPGTEPHGESDPLDLGADGAQRRSAEGVAALEAAVLGAPGIGGVVLRYGRLYGEGTWSASPDGRAPLHVDAAAHVALLAITNGSPGIYNIAEDDGAVSIEKARRELGFDPDFRLAI
jgi:nucleoside-diphosphate-sugar epimerase